MDASKLISLNVVATRDVMEEMLTKIVSSLSNDFELIERSQPYPCKFNTKEVNVYLDFQIKEDRGAIAKIHMN